MKIFHLITALFVLAAFLLGARFVWTKYWLGEKDVTLADTIEKTKKDLSQKTEELNQQLGKVLGESKTGKEVDSYVRPYLPQSVKEEIEKSEVVKQVQEEVVGIVNQASQTIKDLPQSEVKKIKRGIKEEICNQLLKEEER